MASDLAVSRPAGCVHDALIPDRLAVPRSDSVCSHDALSALPLRKRQKKIRKGGSRETFIYGEMVFPYFTVHVEHHLRKKDKHAFYLLQTVWSHCF